MDFETFRALYDQELAYNPKAYENISAILEKAEELFVREKQDSGYRGDIGQAWRSWIGHNFEKLALHILSKLIDEAGLQLKLIQGSILERQQTDVQLSQVKRNILVDFGEFGCFMPDADIVIYDPSDSSVKAIISCKISLRERIAQTGYWKLRLRSCPITQHIRMFFITPDRDRIIIKEGINKSKAILLHELDAAYILRENLVEQYNLRKLEWIKEDLHSL